MKIQLSFALALICALMITACGGGGTATPVSADLNGFDITKLEGTNASLASKKGPAGTVVETGYIIDGNKSGQWITFDDKGKIQTVTNYISGLKNGPELELTGRGQIQARTDYKNNQLHGLAAKYKSGRAEQEISYKDGQYDGPTKMYFRNGKLQKEIGFKNGKQHGPLKYYDEEGNITLEYEYKNGEKVGEAKTGGK